MSLSQWTLWVAIAAVLISTVAVITSSQLTRNQIRLSRQALQVQPFYNFMLDFRGTKYHDDFNYVVNDLKVEHPPSEQLGVYDLPEPAKSAALNILYFYQNATSFVAYGLMDEEKMI